MPNAEKSSEKLLKLTPNQPTLRLALTAMFIVVAIAAYKHIMQYARAKTAIFGHLHCASIFRPSQLLL